MPLSVRLDPAVEARLDEEVRRLGVTRSQFVQDALERTLGMKSPAELLARVRSGTPNGDPEASGDVSAKVREKLRAKRPD